MKKTEGGTKAVIRLMFRLLPVQILLAAVGAVNGIVSSYFASNYVGISAMSAVGLYFPLSLLLSAISTMLSGGSAILCGKYMGRNEQDRVRNVFSLNLLLAAAVGGIIFILFLVLGLADLTGFLTGDETVRPLFNVYLIGQAIGVLPFLAGNQLPVYLSMENRQNLTMQASLVYIGINVLLNCLFVQILHLEAFGIALSSSLGLWMFFGIQASFFLGGKANIRLQLKHLSLEDGRAILRTGFPGAASNGYQAARGIIVNSLLNAFVGSAGVSAFAAANNLLGIFWGVPVGMLAVSRLMISLSMGEEDRQTLTAVMRNMLIRFVPVMCGISAVIILCAEPFTRLFYQDPSESVYMMTVWGFRLLPLCMPLSIVCMHFICYGQAAGRRLLVHILALLDGVVCVAGFSALLIRFLGIISVYVANILNGIVCILVIIAYSWIQRKRPPRSVEELMALPDDFGVEADARIDISVRSMDEVLTVSRQVTDFCRRRGLDERRSYISGLCLEEMAGNIVEHGFTSDRRPHMIDIRVVHKNDDLVLRIRDDCRPFNPKERNDLTDPADMIRNIGIRLVYKTARDVEYQSVLGLNVLTIRI